MNKTVVNTLLYGVCGVGITYVLYLLGGNGQVSAAVFIKMSMIYILQLILLCLVQTVCMILFSGLYSQCAGFDLLVCAGSVWFLPCGGSLAVAAGKLGNVYEKGRDDRRRCNRDIVLHRGDSVCVIVDRSATNR